jgi:hypothetical protein
MKSIYKLRSGNQERKESRHPEDQRKKVDGV